MCRPAIRLLKKILVLTASPVNGAVMNGAVSAKERRLPKNRSTNTAVNITKKTKTSMYGVCFCPR